jgi:hypothetical protein
VEETAQVEEKRLIILLNLRKVLSTDEKAALQGWQHTLMDADIPELSEIETAGMSLERLMA